MSKTRQLTASLAFDVLILSRKMLLNCESGKPVRQCPLCHDPVLPFPPFQLC